MAKRASSTPRVTQTQYCLRRMWHCEAVWGRNRPLFVLFCQIWIKYGNLGKYLMPVAPSMVLPPPRASHGPRWASGRLVMRWHQTSATSASHFAKIGILLQTRAHTTHVGPKFIEKVQKLEPWPPLQFWEQNSLFLMHHALFYFGGEGLMQCEKPR